MAQAATQSMLALQDEDTIDTTHLAKVQRTDGDGFEVGKNLVTESQSKKIADDQSDKILQQVTLLFESVKLLVTQMREGFETEGIRKKEGRKNLEEKNGPQHGRRIQERTTRKTAGSTFDGSGIQKNEENARQLVQKKLAVMKDKIKNLKIDSGRTVCSEASAGVAGPVPLLGHHRFLGGKWNSKVVSQIIQRVALKELRMEK